jgi:hypothetical protein
LNPLIKKLADSDTLRDARLALNELGAGLSTRKLVETAFTLRFSDDPQQRNHSYSFMDTALQELELQNYNSSGGFHDGSFQSSENELPYTNPAMESPDGSHSMMGATDTENQFSTGQFLRQLQYTIQQEMRNHYNKMVKPTYNELQNNSKIIKNMSGQVREAKLDATYSMSHPISETINSEHVLAGQIVMPNDKFREWNKVKTIKKHNLEQTRNEMSELDRILDNNPNDDLSMYG